MHIQILTILSTLVATANPLLALEISGLAAVVDGSTANAYAPVFEFSSIKFPQDRFEMILPNGKPFSGLKIHIPKEPIPSYIDYRRKDHRQLLTDMELMSKTYVHAKPLLAERIEKLRKTVESEGDATVEAIAELKPLAPEGSVTLTIDDRLFEDVWPSSFRNGKIGFIYKEGVFYMDSTVLRYSFLMKLGSRFKDFGGKKDYKKFLETFTPSALVDLKYYTGLYLIDVDDDDTITLMTDHGLISCKSSDIKKEVLENLLKNYDSRKVIIEEYRKSSEKEMAEQVAYFNKVDEIQQQADKKLQDLADAQDSELAEEEKNARNDVILEEIVTGIKFVGGAIVAYKFVDLLTQGFFPIESSQNESAPYPYCLPPDELERIKGIEKSNIDNEKRAREPNN